MGGNSDLKVVREQWSRVMLVQGYPEGSGECSATARIPW